MSKNIVYSNDGENFSCGDDIGMVADQIACDIEDLKIGSILTLYSGESSKPLASRFMISISEILNEQAIGSDFSEWVEDCWPESTKEQDEEIDTAVSKLVDEWATKHGFQPQFFEVNNIKEMKVKITNIDILDWIEVTA